MTTRCPFFTKREMPPSASRAFRVAAAGSPEITARSDSSAARRKARIARQADGDARRGCLQKLPS